MISFEIPGELLSHNEYTNKNRHNRYSGAEAKKNQTGYCAFHIRKAMNNGLSIPDDALPVDVNIKWFMKNRRKDKDNITSSKKFILDGMVQAGLLSNDGWKQIGDFSDKIRVDKDNPRVVVELVRSEED